MAVELSRERSLVPPNHEMEEVDRAKVLSRPYDSHVEPQRICRLDRRRFQEYLSKKDAALVMFYDPIDPRCAWPKENFYKAAETSEPRREHGYATVDCSKDPRLCSMEAVDVLPFFKLYSRGRPTCYVRDSHIFPYSAMITFVDNADLIGKVTNPKNTKVKTYCEALWSIVEKIPIQPGPNFSCRSSETAVVIR